MVKTSASTSNRNSCSRSSVTDVSMSCGGCAAPPTGPRPPDDAMGTDGANSTGSTRARLVSGWSEAVRFARFPVSASSGSPATSIGAVVDGVTVGTGAASWSSASSTSTSTLHGPTAASGPSGGVRAPVSSSSATVCGANAELSSTLSRVTSAFACFFPVSSRRSRTMSWTRCGTFFLGVDVTDSDMVGVRGSQRCTRSRKAVAGCVMFGAPRRLCCAVLCEHVHRSRSLGSATN
mmetsp:Transcript_51052/g.119809  ORF Transcript_51052/g.119809 Transcript_51052/m.119809 type:complete len:235 (+) Transcript_51052:1138-1842(+)